jgi:hypothetical protein
MYSNLACGAFEAMPTDVQVHWDPRKNNTFNETLLDSYHQTAMQSLFDRPWWYRVWTLQESLLEPNLIFVCGHRQLSANTLAAISKSYFRRVRSCCREFFWNKDGGAIFKLMDILSTLWVIRTLRW